MKTQEFINFMGETKNKLLKADQLQETIQKKLEVKDYISIKDKKELVDSIVDECILYENGVYKFNNIDKYICFTMKTLEAYTNIELSEDIEEDYDLLCKAKLLEVVISTFQNEYDDVNILLQMKCDYVLSENGLEAQVGRFLDNILEKLDGFAEILSDKIDSFDFNNLPFNIEDVEKIMKLINMKK